MHTIKASVSTDLNIHKIMNNYDTHKILFIRNLFARHPRFSIHFTSTSASWLNQVEHWFATRAQKQIRRFTLRSTRQLEGPIRDYLNQNSAYPKPLT